LLTIANEKNDKTIISFKSRVSLFADAQSRAAKNEGLTVVPIAYTIKEVCSLSRVGKTTLYAAIGRGELVARKLGKKTLILEEDFRRWIEALPIIDSASL
jgi:excisionase family DNA binding protein